MGLTSAYCCMQGLVDSLVGYVFREVKHGAKSGGNRWSKVGDVVNFMFMKADSFYEVYLDFIGH